MVRGGQADRTVRRARIFALAKVNSNETVVILVRICFESVNLACVAGGRKGKVRRAPRGPAAGVFKSIKLTN